MRAYFLRFICRRATTGEGIDNENDKRDRLLPIFITVRMMTFWEWSAWQFQLNNESDMKSKSHLIIQNGLNIGTDLSVKF